MRPDTDSIIRRRIDTGRRVRPEGADGVDGIPAVSGMGLALGGSLWWRTISPNTRQVLVDVTSGILSRLRTADSGNDVPPFREKVGGRNQAIVRLWLTDRFGDKLGMLCTGSYVNCEGITLHLPCRLNLVPGSDIRMDILRAVDSQDFIPADGTISHVSPSPDGFPDAHLVDVTFRRIEARN